MRFVAASALALLFSFAGLATYELAVLAGVVVSIGIGLFNLVRLGQQASAIQELQEGQAQRIDRLPPPPGE